MYGSSQVMGIPRVLDRFTNSCEFCTEFHRGKRCHVARYLTATQGAMLSFEMNFCPVCGKELTEETFMIPQ